MMHLSTVEMCSLCVAGGWIAAGVCAWIFGWWKRDVKDLSFGEIRELLIEIRDEIRARGMFRGKAGAVAEKQINDDLA